MDHLDEDLIAGAIGESNPSTQRQGGILMKKNWIKWTAIAAAVALVLTGGIFMTQLTVGADNTVVALDVNPSLEIEVNRKNRVVEVRALNEEAEIVIGDMDFEKIDLEIAVNALIGSMLQHGYLSDAQNSILISVATKNEEKADALQTQLSEKVTALLENSRIEASIITQTFSKDDGDDKDGEIETNENEKPVSPARAALIEKILAAGLVDANGVAYTYDQLALLKVNELKLILESKDLTVDGIESSGTAADGQLIGKEQAVAIALEKAGLTEDAITDLDIEIDVSKKTQAIFYEIEFDCDGYEYEYEMIAATGEIIKEEIELDDDDDRDDRDDHKDHDDRNDRDDRDEREEGEDTTPAETDENGETVATPEKPETPAKPENSGNKDDGKFPVGDEYIAIKDATAIAYEYAGVQSEDVRDMERKFKIKDGKPVYKIEFEIDGQEHEYIIDALTGEILHNEIDD